MGKPTRSPQSNGISEEAPLSPTEAADEALVMGLRLSEGIDADTMARRFGLASIVDWRRVDRLAASGHLMRDGGRIALARKGRLLLDHFLGEIALETRVSAAFGPTPGSPARQVAGQRSEQPAARLSAAR